MLATDAALNSPQSVACVNEEVYIADTGNNRIRKIFSNGTITTIAGNGTYGHCGDGGIATDACLHHPVSVVVSHAGEVFISDEFQSVVWKVDSNGIISTFAGTPGSSGYNGDGDGGLAIDAKLYYPRGLAFNDEGELLIADSVDDRIRKVDNFGVISTVVAGLSYTYDVGVGRDGELFIVENGDRRITKFDNNGLKIQIAGFTPSSNGYSNAEYIGDFYVPENALLAFVSSVSVLSDTELIVADTYNQMIKKVDINAKSIVSLTGANILSYPRGAIVVNHDIYLADYGNHCIRKIGLHNSVISVVAGVCGSGGYYGDGSLATSAQLFYPSSVVIDSNGDFFIADSGNHIIRKVNSGGIITTIAGIVGRAKFSENNVSALSSNLYEPTDLVIAPNGELYISDHGNHCIRKIDASGKIQIAAGQCGMNGFDGDGGLATSALLFHPRGLAFTEVGELLIADYGNSVIRKVDMHTGIITTVAGVGKSVGYTGDGGSSTSAQLTRPTGVAVGTNGDYYIADFGNHLIRVVRPTCLGVSNNDSTVCSGHGYCVAPNTCRCHDGYGDVFCSLSNCFGRWSNESSVCSGHGECVGHDNCLCDPGYASDICSEVKCPENGCLNITESPRNHQHCFVPTFSAQFPPVNLISISWILEQFGHIDTVTLDKSSPTFDYAPHADNMYDGNYTVSVIMYYKTGLGEVRLRNTTIERRANCSICSLGSSNCRYTIGLDNQDMEMGKTVSINRMIPFTIRLIDRDTFSSNGPIQNLEIQWIHPQTSLKTQSIGENISMIQSDDGRELTIFPTDPVVGMNQNVTIDITCRYKLPHRNWTIISFKIRTTPSKDITPTNGFEIQPVEGYTLITPFYLEAKGWNSSNLTYSFSFHDPIDNVEIRLSQSKTPLINSTLPTGSLPYFNLIMRLRVFDLGTGNFGFAEKIISVKPYFGEGLLTQRLSDVVEGGDYREMIAIASQVSVASQKEVKDYSDDLSWIVNKMVNYTKSTAVNQTDPVSIEQQMYVVDLITRNRLVVSEESKRTSLDIVSLIIEKDNESTNPTITNNAVQNMANIISNVADGGYKDQSVAQKTLSTSEQLAAFVASDLFLDGAPKTVTSKNFKLTVSLASSHLLANQSIGSTAGKVDAFDIPSQFDIVSSNEQGGTIVSSLIVFTENPYSPMNRSESSREEPVSSHVIDIKFKDVNGTVFPVTNLSQPLMINFDRRKANHQGACPEATFKCQYWSESDRMWRSDGCHWVDSPMEQKHIACACSHTTSFSAFVLEKGDSCVKYAGIKITGIVFNSIYAIICLPILIGLFITRNYQPVKSRFIAPFIGITAIIVDSVIQGIIRNALSLSAQQSASDAFSYVIMLTANPLFVTSLFVFLWQQIRYLMLQNIYRLMPNGKNRALQTKFLRLNRLLASKTIFTLVSVCVGSCVLAYFAVLVGVAAHYNDSKQVKKRDSIVIVQAVSFASFLIILALGILVTLFIDIGYSLKRESTVKIKHRGLSTHQTEQIRVAKTARFGFIWMHFTTDPLLFRAEACFIFVALVIIIVLYSIGIATIVLEYRQKHPVMIVRTIIEILFMFVRIMALGGFVFVMSLRAFIKHHQATQSRNKSLPSEPSQTISAATGELDLKVLNILKHDIGYQLLFEYCQQEFSLENVLLWRELESARSDNLLWTAEQRKQQLQYFKEMYLESNSARQLNISHKSKLQFLKTANRTDELTVTDAEEAFKILYGVCMINIAETLTRFCQTEHYQTFKHVHDMVIELKEDFIKLE